MSTRRRRRPDELLDRELGESAKETAGERSIASETTRLQELIGNASTTELLARSPLQRDSAGTEAAPAKGGEEPKQDVTYTMTVDDVGTFVLLSWSWGTSDSGTGGGGGGPGKAQMRDLSATKKPDEHTAKLMQHASSGRHIKTVELRTQRGGEWFLIKLKDVLVNSFQMGDGEPPTETFGLAFAEVEYDSSEKGK